MVLLMSFEITVKNGKTNLSNGTLTLGDGQISASISAGTFERGDYDFNDSDISMLQVYQGHLKVI